MHLLERDAQLASLKEYAAEAGSGNGRMVLIAGEAGAGKSALVEQLHLDLPDPAWCWGACDGLFTPRPLAPVIDIAGTLGGEVLALCRTDAARDEVFGALLRQVSTPGRLHVLVIEDVHWADEATIDLLRFLGRRIKDAPVLLLATYRDEGLTATDPLRIALGDLAGQRSVRRISLPTLSQPAVAELAAGSGLDPDGLYRLTGGNPFYVSQAVQAGTGGVPASARDAVLARAARLNEDARAVLDVAALIGGRASLRLLESAAGRPPGAIDDLVESGLVVGDGTSLRFRHEIGRLAVAEAVTVRRRAAAHGRILAALLAERCDDDARLAYHAEAAGDTQAALRHAAAAARRAAALASHHEAAAQFERALRFASGVGDATVAALYDGFAYEASLLDRWQDAADARERAMAGWRAAGERLREGDAMRWLGVSLCALSRGDECIAAVERAIELLEPLGISAELSWAYANLAAMWMVRGASQRAIPLARHAQEAAAELNLTEVLSDALNSEACAARMAGQAWSDTLQLALEVALAGRHDVQAARAYVNLQASYVAERNWEAADRYFRHGLAYCDEHDLAAYSILLRSERTAALERTGRWTEAVALSNGLLRKGGPSPNIRLCPLSRLGTVLARRGEQEAWQCLDEAAELADRSGEAQSIVAVRLARAEAYWLDGQEAAARQEAAFAAAVAHRGDRWERGAIAVWLRRTGRPPAQGRSAEAGLPDPYQRELDGDWAGAATLWSELGCPYEAALALVGANTEAALREALSIVSGLGATAAVRLTQRRMRRLEIRSIPAGPRTATRRHPLGLTRREHEVLDLICAGLTNAEIAGKLFIAVKTVDHHVSAVLAKLQAPSRSAAAAKATELGLAELPIRARLRAYQG